VTFTELKTAVKDYCGLTSTDADTRVGKALNRHYRRITSQIGLDATRFVTRQVSMTIGQRTVTFTDIEKIDRVIDVTDATAIRLLQEVSPHDMRSLQPGAGDPSTWALQNTDADSVVALFDTVPQTAYVLQADGWSTVSDLSGSDEPAFPESFHDVLSWSVIAEELLKKEKAALADKYEQRAEKLLQDLRFYLADSHTRTTRQGGSSTTTTAGSGGGSATVGSTSWTQTGLITFDRDPSAPFAVSASSAVVTNLDADKLDGYDASGLLAQAASDILPVDLTSASEVSGVLPVANTNVEGILTDENAYVAMQVYS
jgi:hypothetical protein